MPATGCRPARTRRRARFLPAGPGRPGATVLPRTSARAHRASWASRQRHHFNPQGDRPIPGPPSGRPNHGSDEQLGGEAAVEAHGAPAAEGAHDGNELFQREPDRHRTEDPSEVVEPGESHEHAAISQLADGEPGVAVVEVDQAVADSQCAGTRPSPVSSAG